MITRIPALEFLSGKVGVYQIENKDLAIHIKRAGYGFVLQVDEPAPKSPMFGIIGVSGTDLVLHSNIGLANVLIFSWPHAFSAIDDRELEIEFIEKELAISLTLEFFEASLKISFVSNGKIRKSLVGTRPSKSSKPTLSGAT